MKKGVIQIETIIVIILALLALVIIAAAFTGGFNQLWGKIMGFTTTATTESAKADCTTWCASKDPRCNSGIFTIDGISKTCSALGITAS
jgi:uncharacterized protein (UPF0333 family)